MEAPATAQAAADGLLYALERPVRNTLDMLRLVYLGNEHGVGGPYLAAMQGEPFGVPADEIREVLATDQA